MMKTKIIVQLILMAAVVLSLGRKGASAAKSSGVTELVSIASDGTQANGDILSPSISADGRFVAFTSYYANNLVQGDTNGMDDVFVHDRVTGETRRVSVASDGTQGNNHSFDPTLSADGRYVAFSSYATNLVGGDTNNKLDVFVHDQETGVTERVNSSGGEQPSISADGRFVAFSSGDVYVRDRQMGVTELVGLDPDGLRFDEGTYFPFISADGRFVLFSDRTFIPEGVWGHYEYELYVRDRQAGITEKVDLACQTGWDCRNQRGASISNDGRYVAFSAGDKRNVFVHDRVMGVTERISVEIDEPLAVNHDPSIISADGRYVAYYSSDGNQVIGDTNGMYDIFVWDQITRSTSLISVANDGSQGNGSSFSPSISANGRYVAFMSGADNLVAGDTNGEHDIFVRDRGSESIQWVYYFPLVAR